MQQHSRRHSEGKASLSHQKQPPFFGAAVTLAPVSWRATHLPVASAPPEPTNLHHHPTFSQHTCSHQNTSAPAPQALLTPPPPGLALGPHLAGLPVPGKQLAVAVPRDDVAPVRAEVDLARVACGGGGGGGARWGGLRWGAAIGQGRGQDAPAAARPHFWVPQKLRHRQAWSLPRAAPWWRTCHHVPLERLLAVGLDAVPRAVGHNCGHGALQDSASSRAQAGTQPSSLPSASRNRPASSLPPPLPKAAGTMKHGPLAALAHHPCFPTVQHTSCSTLHPACSLWLSMDWPHQYLVLGCSATEEMACISGSGRRGSGGGEGEEENTTGERIRAIRASRGLRSRLTCTAQVKRAFAPMRISHIGWAGLHHTPPTRRHTSAAKGNSSRPRPRPPAMYLICTGMPNSHTRMVLSSVPRAGQGRGWAQSKERQGLPSAPHTLCPLPCAPTAVHVCTKLQACSIQAPERKPTGRLHLRHDCQVGLQHAGPRPPQAAAAGPNTPAASGSISPPAPSRPPAPRAHPRWRRSGGCRR